MKILKLWDAPKLNCETLAFPGIITDVLVHRSAAPYEFLLGADVIDASICRISQQQDLLVCRICTYVGRYGRSIFDDRGIKAGADYCCRTSFNDQSRYCTCKRNSLFFRKNGLSAMDRFDINSFQQFCRCDF